MKTLNTHCTALPIEGTVLFPLVRHYSQGRQNLPAPAVTVECSARQMAKHIKQELNKIWPEVSFQMAADKYSIEAYYLEGPTQDQVTRVMQVFENGFYSVNGAGELVKTKCHHKPMMRGARFYSDSFPYACCSAIDLTSHTPDAKEMIRGFAAFLNTDSGAETKYEDAGENGVLVLTKAANPHFYYAKLETAFAPLGLTVKTCWLDGFRVIGFLTDAGMAIYRESERQAKDRN